jgi:hypothetical protein
MVSFEVKENMMKYIVEFRLTKIGEIIILSLIHWNDNLPSLSHSKWESFFNNILRVLTISTKFRMNLLTMIIWLKKDCKDFFSLGREIFLMTSTMVGSIVILPLEII